MIPALLTTVSLLALASVQAGQGKHLFILSGQSNMVGLKYEKSFVPIVESELGKERVIVVADAQSGCPIRRWHKDWKPKSGTVKAEKQAYGDLYDRLMKKVKPAIEGQEIETVTFIWMQGERDAKEGHGEVYAKSLVGLIDQLKADLKRKDVSFVIGRISDHGIGSDKKIPHWQTVRDAQVQVAEADPRGAWVDTDDFNGDKDGLHYSGAGYVELGRRFAEEAVKLAKKGDASPNLQK